MTSIFEVVPIGNEKWFFGLYRGPEGRGELAIVHYPMTGETKMPINRGVAPDSFFNEAAKYMTSNGIPLPKREQN